MCIAGNVAMQIEDLAGKCRLIFVSIFTLWLFIDADGFVGCCKQHRPPFESSNGLQRSRRRKSCNNLRWRMKQLYLMMSLRLTKIQSQHRPRPLKSQPKDVNKIPNQCRTRMTKRMPQDAQNMLHVGSNLYVQLDNLDFYINLSHADPQKEQGTASRST